MRRQLMTTDEAADLLRWCPEYIRRLARARLIPAMKLGRHWRFKEHELLEWAAAGCPSPTEQPRLFENNLTST